MISNLAGTNSDKIQLNRRVSSMTLLLKRQSTKDWIKEIHEELKRQAIAKNHLILKVLLFTQKSYKMISNLAGNSTSDKKTRYFTKRLFHKKKESTMDWMKDIHDGMRQANKPLLCLFAQFQYLDLPPFQGGGDQKGFSC